VDTSTIVSRVSQEGNFGRLRLNQPAAHVCERHFRQFVLGNIRYHAYNPQDSALFVSVRSSPLEQIMKSVLEVSTYF
jgi:hypothetical protein